MECACEPARSEKLLFARKERTLGAILKNATRPRRARARRRSGVRIAMGRAAGATLVGPRALRRAARGGVTVCGHGERRRVHSGRISRRPLLASARVPPRTTQPRPSRWSRRPRRVRGRRGVVLGLGPGARRRRDHPPRRCRGAREGRRRARLGRPARARGPGLVQVMALRMPSSRRRSGAARAAKGKRPRDVPFREKADCATARVVLGLAHDAKHAFDLKWRPSPPTVFDGAVAADETKESR